MTNLQPVNWHYALLTRNPFPSIPPERSEEAVWAGMSSLKAQFDALFAEALTTSTSQIVLNRGAWGSGKTHAAVFFGIRDRFPQVEGDQVQDTSIIYVRTPKEGSKADEILYRDIIESIRFDQLRQVIQTLFAEHGQQGALEILQDAAQSEVLGRTIWLFGLEEQPTAQLALFGAETAAGEWRRKLEACLFSQATKTDLQQFGLSRGIDNAQDRFRILSTILHSIIGFAPTEDFQAHQRVILWIDEMEDLIYLTSRQHRPFTQGLRDLIDRLPHYLTLFMNFTLAAPEALEDINVTLGAALVDRITHRVYFQEPNEDEAFEYICDLMRQFRTQEPENLELPLTYPFTEDALRLAISTLPDYTPRDLNQRCRFLVTKVLQQGIITAPGEGMITTEFISNLDAEQMRLDLG